MVTSSPEFKADKPTPTPPDCWDSMQAGRLLARGSSYCLACLLILVFLLLVPDEPMYASVGSRIDSHALGGCKSLLGQVSLKALISTVPNSSCVQRRFAPPGLRSCLWSSHPEAARRSRNHCTVRLVLRYPFGSLACATQSAPQSCGGQDRSHLHSRRQGLGQAT